MRDALPGQELQRLRSSARSDSDSGSPSCALSSTLWQRRSDGEAAGLTFSFATGSVLASLVTGAGLGSLGAGLGAAGRGFGHRHELRLIHKYPGLYQSL